MMKVRAFIYFRDGYDYEAVDDICERYDEADLWYDDNYARFQGTPERLQEFVRAIKSVEDVVKITTV